MLCQAKCSAAATLRARDSGAGCITASGSSVSVTATTLDDCQIGATGADHRALFLEGSTSVEIKDTTITPTDASDSETASGAVNLPLDPQVLDLVTKGCETSPCESGHACSFHDFSLWCAPCAEDNQFSADGRACTQCDPGKQPNEDKSDCEECSGDDEYCQ